MIEEKCQNCTKLEELFEEANEVSYKHDYVRIIYDYLKRMYDERKIDVYMADYYFPNFYNELSRESQFTYKAYLQCVNCKKIFLLGVCIRGEPMFKVLNNQPDYEEFKQLTKKCKRTYYSDVFDQFLCKTVEQIRSGEFQ